jgi:predicted O-linked N-acetylglucosamine transferase (SPINDLY family)
MLSSLRVTLRARLQASPLMDEERFTRDLENLYRQMWRTYCNQGA